jgi:lipoyl(octanoyl) transferase
MRSIALHRLGRVPYARSQALQRELVQLRRRGEVRDTLLLVEHPPVFTLGRLQSCEANVRVTREEIEAAGASVVQSERGGNVTYHGPGQLVAYPILDLHGHRKDMRWFVHSLEDAMIATAAAFGVTARRGVAGEEGIWVDDRKLGALGVHVTRWVTSHGLALNVDPDLRFFDMIVPCGLQRPVTSLAREVAAGRRATLTEATTQFEAAFSSTFESALDGEEEPPPWRRAFDREVR